MKPINLLILLLLAQLLTALPLLAEEAREAQARRLFNALGCKGCHMFEGDGGSLAPPLDQIGSRMTREEISARLARHADPQQNGFMPSYRTSSPEDLDLLSDFLYNHK